MYNDFIVKVHRYWEEDNGSRGWDGWYFSKVYAIDGNEFLVYDDGGMSAYNGEEDFCETGFNWVDFTATMDRCGGNGRQPIVEPLASFNIADYLADSKTENSSENPNNCEPRTDCGDFADRLAYERGVKHAWGVAQKAFDSTLTFYEAEDLAKQIDKDINVRSKDEPQTDCGWK